MQRRDFIGTAVLGATGLALSSIGARAEDTKAGKAPAKSSPLVVSSPDAIKALSQFAEEAAKCALKGEICAHHCEMKLANGETEFADCNIAVRQMNVVCEAITKLAAMKSVRTKDVLDACIAACQACKDACDEHKAHWAHGMHLECKECSEQCGKTIAAANKLKKILA